MLFVKRVSEYQPKKLYYAIRSGNSSDKDKSFSEEVANSQIEYKLCNVTKIHKNSVTFGDGSEEDIDTIIYATGYKYCLPFFDPNDKIVEFEGGGDRGFYFGPLYKKMFSINHPNIIFLGVIQRAGALYLTYERQAQLVKQYVMGELTLPSKEEMLLSLEEEKDINLKANIPLSKFFQLSNLDGYYVNDYHEDLCKLTNLPINQELYDSISKINKTIMELILEGRACNRKMIDWDSVYGDFDYSSSSDLF